MPFARTLLALTRPARLPTVWSNCLAGWWLGGGGNTAELVWVVAGATMLYLGGAFLNDAFDVEYDQEHRQTRPIPAGLASPKAVWRWSLAWLVAGTLVLLWVSRLTGWLALALVCFIVLYNTLHRLVAFGPIFYGLCRCLLYPLGASVAERGVTGWCVWSGVALGLYIAGQKLLARAQEPREAPAWAAALLLAPIALAMLLNTAEYREPALLLSGVLVLWTAQALRRTFWSSEPDLFRTSGELSAGIVLVDWLAVGPVPAAFSEVNHAPRELSLVFIGLFLFTLALQKSRLA